MTSFENWLKFLHSKYYNGTDDNMPDAFDNWLSSLDTEQLLGYGQMYGETVFMEGRKATLETINK